MSDSKTATNKLPINSNFSRWGNFIETNFSPMNNIIDLIKYPVITEKSYLALFKNRQYTFDVDIRLSKPQIQKLFENLFEVNVTGINTHIPPRKKLRVGPSQGYRTRYKRVILTVKEGQSLNYKITK
jgi:large subunit ribosomal protein L23